MNEIASRIASDPAPLGGGDEKAPRRDGVGDRPSTVLAIAATALFLVIGILESWLLRRLAPGMSVLSSGLVSGATLGGLAIIGLSRFRLWHQLGFRRPGRWRHLVLFSPFVLVGLAPLTAGVQAAPGTLVAWGVAALLIAFYKMVLLGGLLDAFESKGRWQAAGLAALVFALFELGGVLAGGKIVTTGLLSIMYFFLAFAYGAAWLRTGTIWPLVIANALMTISAAASQRSVETSNLASSAPEILSGIVVAVLLAAYGAMLMRKTRMDSISPKSDKGERVS